jgi:hypothetical protein
MVILTVVITSTISNMIGLVFIKDSLLSMIISILSIIPIVVFLFKVRMLYIKGIFTSNNLARTGLAISPLQIPMVIFTGTFSFHVLHLVDNFFSNLVAIISSNEFKCFILKITAFLLTSLSRFSPLKSLYGIGKSLYYYVDNLIIGKAYKPKVTYHMFNSIEVSSPVEALNNSKTKHWKFIKGIPKIPTKDYTIIPSTYKDPLINIVSNNSVKNTLYETSKMISLPLNKDIYLKEPNLILESYKGELYTGEYVIKPFNYAYEINVKGNYNNSFENLYKYSNILSKPDRDNRELLNLTAPGLLGQDLIVNAQYGFSYGDDFNSVANIAESSSNQAGLGTGDLNLYSTNPVDMKASEILASMDGDYLVLTFDVNELKTKKSSFLLKICTQGKKVLSNHFNLKGELAKVEYFTFEDVIFKEGGFKGIGELIINNFENCIPNNNIAKVRLFSDDFILEVKNSASVIYNKIGGLLEDILNIFNNNNPGKKSVRLGEDAFKFIAYNYSSELHAWLVNPEKSEMINSNPDTFKTVPLSKYGDYFIHYNDIIEIHNKIYKCTMENVNADTISLNKTGFLPIKKKTRSWTFS